MTAEETTQEAPVEEVKTTQESTKKPKKGFARFGLNDILDASCWDPENFDDHEAWLKEVQEAAKALDGFNPVYKGVRRYEITAHCIRYTIRARRHVNGGYQILSVLQQAH